MEGENNSQELVLSFYSCRDRTQVSRFGEKHPPPAILAVPPLLSKGNEECNFFFGEVSLGLNVS